MGKIKDTVIDTEDKAVYDKKFVNSSFLVFPTDIYGLTKDLKKAIIASASRINGHEDKYKLFHDTLAVGLKHIEARYGEAIEARSKLYDK